MPAVPALAAEGLLHMIVNPLTWTE